MRTDAGIYRFGPFELDPDRRRLARGGTWLLLPDRQMDVLLLLTARAGQVVPKDTLIAEAWPAPSRDAADLTAAWVLPVEPLIDVRAHRTAWAPALAALHQRSV